MKLVFEGNDYRYAAEQILASLMPDEKPEYGDEGSDDSRAVIKLSRGKVFTTATVRMRYRGEDCPRPGTARVRNDAMPDSLAENRECQAAVKLAFYRAAMQFPLDKPVWGTLTGIRPGIIMTRMLESGMSERAAAFRMEKHYLVEKKRAGLCLNSSKASLKVKRELGERDAAVYIGIPFCPTRCAYCSFVSQSTEKSMSLIPPFLNALYREIDALGETVRKLGLNVIAVYIGGGTPTTLSPDQMRTLLEKLSGCIDMGNVREFSVEAGRPDTVTEDKLAVLEEFGVGRISINPQSMSEDVLSAIGRKHSPEDIRTAYAMARRLTHCDINMDIIAGLPDDSPKKFRDTVDEIISMEPENITVHTLALKRGTRILLEGTAIPGKEDVAEMIDYSLSALAGAGYRPYYLYRQKHMSGGYENVGWAAPGKESLYNILIMEELCTVLAAGGGASTKLVNPSSGRIERVYNYKYPREYIDGIDKIIGDKKKIEEFYLGDK